jgi:hypothetical protein
MSFIGGFFGLELPPAPAGTALAGFWGMPPDPALTYSNGRSALAALIASVKPPKLWLPAYLCRSLVEAAQAAHTTVGYFAVDDSLHPDTPFLDSAARCGEMILAVDYFGQPPGAEFLDFARRRGDLLFVEDASQAFDTGAPQWGRWCLRSPRKLVGVPDGGFLCPAAGIQDAERSVAAADLSPYQAACLRFEDEHEQANASWHAANQRREAAECVARRRMSRLSRELLRRLPVEPIAARRRANFRILAGTLDKLMFPPVRQASFVPFGFPVRVARELRFGLCANLAAKGIFPAIHWSDLPSPPTFGAAHGLASELLTLPCDQRYEPDAMLRMADIVREAVERR